MRNRGVGVESLLTVAAFVALVDFGSGFGVDKTSVRVLTTGHLIAAVECQTDNSNCYKYLKVPYAQPPIGPLRFKPSLPVDNLDSIQKDILGVPDRPGPNCLSSSFTTEDEESEDCLYLDLYKPVTGQDLPLVVVLNYFGARDRNRRNDYGWEQFGPEFFATQCGCAVAVVNIRGKGAQGYFTLDDEEYPGNLGESDLKTAMEFLSDNQAKFSVSNKNVHLMAQNEHNAIAFNFVLNHLTKYPIRTVGLFGNHHRSDDPLFALSSEVLKQMSQNFIPTCADKTISKRALQHCLHIIDSLKPFYRNDSFIHNWGPKLKYVGNDSTSVSYEERLKQLGPDRNFVKLFHGTDIMSASNILDSGKFVAPYLNSLIPQASSYSNIPIYEDEMSFNTFTKLLNATICSREWRANPGPMSALQCSLIIQEYLPRENVVQTIQRKDALLLISEALFDKHRKQFLDRLNLFSRNFDTFGYIIDRSELYKMKLSRQDEEEIDFILNSKPAVASGKLGTREDVLFLGFLTSAINNQFEDPYYLEWSWPKYRSITDFLLTVISPQSEDMSTVTVLPAQSYRPRATRFWGGILPTLSESSFHAQHCSLTSSLHNRSLGLSTGASSGGSVRQYPSPSLQEAHLILSTDAELKMAILLGSTAFLGSLVFISCIMLVATNQQLRKVRAEKLIGEEMKRTAGVNCNGNFAATLSSRYKTDSLQGDCNNSAPRQQCQTLPATADGSRHTVVHDDFFDYTHTRRYTPEHHQQVSLPHVNGSAKPLLYRH